jgi:hypothetical protein
VLLVVCVNRLVRFEEVDLGDAIVKYWILLLRGQELRGVAAMEIRGMEEGFE